MTLLHWSTEHVLQSWLATTAGFPVQTDSNKAPGWQVTPYHSLQGLLPARLCLWGTLSSRGSAMLCLLLPPGFPTKSWRDQAVSAPLETQVSVPRVWTGAGEMSGPGLGGGYSTRAPPWAAWGQLGTWRRKSPQLFLLQLFITNKANLRSGSVVL